MEELIEQGRGDTRLTHTGFLDRPSTVHSPDVKGSAFRPARRRFLRKKVHASLITSSCYTRMQQVPYRTVGDRLAASYVNFYIANGESSPRIPPDD